jgi:hypothetical protein
MSQSERLCTPFVHSAARNARCAEQATIQFDSLPGNSAEGGGGGSRNGAGLQENMDNYSHKISQKGPCQDSPKKSAIVRPHYLPCNAFWGHGRTLSGCGRKNGLKALSGGKEIMSQVKGKEVVTAEVLFVWNLSGGTCSASPPAHRIDEAGSLGRFTGPVVFKDEQGNMD